MGLFGGKSEEDLRASGQPTTARVTYVDDTGKRRANGSEAKVKIQLKIDSGAARGRDMDQTKWVPVVRMPRVGETVPIRFDPDHVDDWAWGDAAMYTPSAPAAPGGPPPAPMPSSMAPPLPTGTPQPGPAPQPGDNDMAAFIESAAGPWGKMPGIKQMIEAAVQSGNVTWSGSSQVIDARANPELRNQILGALQQAGYDVNAMNAGQQFAIPGTAGAPAPASAAPAAPAGGASGEDVSERLKRVDKLLEQGLVTADEHRDLRQKIIDSI
jgi:hypothetical protein